ncbi:MAG: hypothetical protein ACLFVQ_02205 [Chitinispirillaceae bacterium]
MMKSLYKAAVCVTFLVFQTFSTGQAVSGSANIPLSGPVTEEISEKAKTTAEDFLRRELYIWLKENMSTTLDTANSGYSYVLDKFKERCLTLASEKSAFEGKIWRFSYVITDKNIREAIESHNQLFDSLARAQWQQFQGAIEQEKFTMALSAGVKALSCAIAHIGSGQGIEQEIRKGVQNFFDRMQVNSSEMVIEGKPGTLPVRSPSVTVAVDSTPLLGLGYSAFVLNGKKAFEVLTDDKGSFSLESYRIPYVHNGNFLTLVPDAQFYTDAQTVISLEDLGLQMNKGQNLSFIYKVTTPTYTLDYRAASPKNEVKLPDNFLADSHIRKYLKDSCNLKPAPTGTTPDLTIRINAEISKPEYPQTGEASMMLLSRIDISGGDLEGSEEMIYEKRHEKGVDIPLGLFIWEASGKLRSKIREILNQF